MTVELRLRDKAVDKWRTVRILHMANAKRASCKTVYSVILNEVKDLSRLKIRDSSLRSE
jgi:hypothetical protein